MGIKARYIVFIVANLLVFQAVAQKTNSGKTEVPAVGNNSSISDTQLKVFNRFPKSTFLDTCNNKNGIPFKILVVGNSITYHGKMEKIGWSHNSGMAATKTENDYAHLIFKKTEKLFPDRKICMRIKNLAKFEREFSTYDFSDVDSLVSYQADVIIFQLGENATFTETNTSSLFKDKYIGFINYIKNKRNPLVICTNPFFPSLEKNKIIEQITLATGSYLADLSHLDFDNQNYAAHEEHYAGDKNMWKVDGIGRHPGDYGMKSIAEQIFIVMNAAKNGCLLGYKFNK